MIEILLQSFTSNQIEIVKAILYFDVFHYPLTRQELYDSSAIHISIENFNLELDSLILQKVLKEEANFVMAVSASEQDVKKRVKGNENAFKVMPLAFKYSRKIASFPFVESVCLSGGLSKSYYDEKGDFDFFIITKPNRLWICRTLLIFRYKFLPKQKKKYWCTNYFISSDDLKIPDINAFTATELAFLIPAVQYDLYLDLLEQNSWYKNRFPNKPKAFPGDCSDLPSTFFKRFLEKFFTGKFGDKIDGWLLNTTLKHWQKKFPELAKEDFELQFRSQKNVCKRHTKGFQNRILNLWEEKQKSYEDCFRISFK